MKEPFDNAFTINQLGFGGFFPFSVWARKTKSGVTTMNICALRVADMSDLIGAYAQETYIVYDVDNPVMEDPATHKLLELDGIVKELNVDCRVYGAHAIAISKTVFTQFIRSLPHYNFSMIDVRSEPDDTVMTRLYKTGTDYDSGEPMLDRISDARVFIYSHDDCYMYAEARDVSFLKKVFARTLWLYGKTVARSRFGWTRQDIPQPPSPFIDVIFPLDSEMTILRKDTKVRRDGITIDYSDEKYAFGEDFEHDVVGTIECDFVLHKWSTSRL